MAHLRDACGCYVFGLQAGRGYSPWYVGKATKGFAQEIFTDHKLRTYNDVVYAGRKGTPVMFFVVRDGRRSKVGASQIDDVESYLIRTAVRRNKDLMNLRKRGVASWGIRGVVHGGRGKATDSASRFKGMLGI